MFHEALYYAVKEDKSVQCTLCPHMCVLREGKAGTCRVRRNTGGILVTKVYGFVSSLNFDPIEKKPLYHYFPGSTILSIGSYGCNLRCFFCQNCTISQTGVEPELPKTYFSPEEIVKIALDKSGNIGIAFTYNEPIVWFEYMVDIARLAKKAGLKTVMVTNGFINKEPLSVLLETIDAFSVDLKAFTEEFYSKVTSSQLEPVKETLIQIRKAGKHLEVVNLVVPELNDHSEAFSDMTKWIASELGKETVLHISRYFPSFKLATFPTPVMAIRSLKRIAEKELAYVYSGNIAEDSNDTFCQKCNNILITRHIYDVKLSGLDIGGCCKACGKHFLKKT